MSRQRSFHDVGDGLRASLLRVGGTQEEGGLHAEVPVGEPGWVGCGVLLGEPGRLAHWRARLGEWLAARYPDVPERTTASWILSWYLYVPAHAGALLLHHERRVPSLGSSGLAFRIGEDRPHPEAIAVLDDKYYCLPTDPGSTRPEAVVVRDERTLAAVLRAQFVAHANRFLHVYGPQTRLGRRQLWAAATDALDNALWSAGRLGGTAEAEGSAVADAALVLESRFPPLTSGSKLRLAAGANGHREWTRDRESCCFSYLLRGESECEGCPRRR